MIQSTTVTYPIENTLEYNFDSTKIEIVNSIAKLKATVSGAAALLYAELDDNQGLVATDSSGNNNHGAFQGGYTENQWTTGKINTAIQGLSNSSGFINFDQLIAFERTDAFSLECWVKSTSSASMMLMSKQLNVGFDGFSLIMASGKLRFVVRDDLSNVIAIETTSNFNDGNWHHVVGTYDGNNLATGTKMYVDNTLITNYTSSDTLAGSILTTANFQISGREGNNSTIDSNTFIDECLVYERELTSAEVSFRWNNGNGTQQIPGPGTSFPTDNPTLEPFGTILATSLKSFTATAIESGANIVKYVIVINDNDMYWTGSAWEISNSYSQTNTDTEINTNITSLSVESTDTIKWKAFLHSDDGSVTPELDQIVIEFEFEEIQQEDISKCIITGYCFDDNNSPVTGDVTAILEDKSVQYKNTIVLYQKLFSTSVDPNTGKFEFSGNNALPETENANNARYKFTLPNGVVILGAVPDVTTRNIWDINNVSRVK